MTAIVTGADEGASCAARMRRVVEVAARNAASVDRDATFPHETLAALRAERLLGVAIPARLGGEDAGIAEIADLCGQLGQACASSAMVFAMHQIKLASLVKHGLDHDWHAAFARDVAERQLLLASSTTEAGIGGDLRNSICAVETTGERFTLVKDAPVISYAKYADAILATARRSPDAASGDQVLVVLRAGKDFTLEQTVGWDTLGMRGTCSEGFRLSAGGSVEQIIPKPFSEIAAQSMLATSHIFWSSVWFGIAADAVARAQAFVKAAAKRMPGTLPPGALRLAEATTRLQAMKATVRGGIERYEAALANESELATIGFAVAMNNLKVAVSSMANEIIQHAMLITGIMGYKNDTPFSVGRHMRDAMSAMVMISNDRILSNTSNLLLASRFDTSLLH